MHGSNDPTTHVVSLSLPMDAAHSVASALAELLWPPADAIGLFDNEDGTWRVEASFTSPPDMAELEQFMRARSGDDFELAIGEVPPADWVTITQSNLHPVQAGRFIVHGSHDRKGLLARRWSIEIDAGQAFGTAHHGSTLGCLVAIDAMAKNSQVQSVLDLGTGSGVLAIAAAKAFPARVIASDLDPVAIEVARENVKLNGVSARVETLVAPGLSAAQIRGKAPFDLVIANILAKPLERLATQIARATRPGSMIVLSGITEKQAARVSAAYHAAGFTRLRRYFVSGWATLVLRRAQYRLSRGECG